MASNTPNLGLLKKDPATDGNETFNIKTMLNDNWDKIDEVVGNIEVPEASTTQKGIVQLSNATDGTKEDVAATERAVKAAYDRGSVADDSAYAAMLKANEVQSRLDTHLADYVRQPAYAGTAGTATAYTVTLNPAPTTIPEGFGITILPHVDSGASPTLKINSNAVVSLKKQDGSAAEMKTGKSYSFRKVGSDFLASSSGEGVKINGQTDMEAYFGETISAGDVVTAFNQFQGKLDNPNISPGYSANVLSFSPDENYLAVASSTLVIYKRSGDTFVKSANPSTIPGGVCYGGAFSPDGIYLAVGFAVSPYFYIYKRSGDTFTKLSNPSVMPTTTIRGIAFTSGSEYLAIGTEYSSPSLLLYKRSGDTFLKLADPSTMPNVGVTGLSFSPDDNYLIATSNSTNSNFYAYKRTGDNFTMLTDVPALDTYNRGNGITFSPDGMYIAIALTSNPFLHIIKRQGDSFVLLPLPKPLILPTGGASSVSFSSDGTHLAVSHATSPYITIYQRSGDTFNKLANWASLPRYDLKSAAFSPLGNYLALGFNSDPYLYIYKYRLTTQKTTSLANVVGNIVGYAKESGVTGDTKKIAALLY